MVEPALAIIACSLGTLRPLIHMFRRPHQSAIDREYFSQTQDSIALGLRSKILEMPYTAIQEPSPILESTHKKSRFSYKQGGDSISLYCKGV
jgi:hypothetical protein